MAIERLQRTNVTPSSEFIRAIFCVYFYNREILCCFDLILREKTILKKYQKKNIRKNKMKRKEE